MSIRESARFPRQLCADILKKVNEDTFWRNLESVYIFLLQSTQKPGNILKIMSANHMDSVGSDFIPMIFRLCMCRKVFLFIIGQTH